MHFNANELRSDLVLKEVFFFFFCKMVKDTQGQKGKNNKGSREERARSIDLMELSLLNVS